MSLRVMSVLCASRMSSGDVDWSVEHRQALQVAESRTERRLFLHQCRRTEQTKRLHRAQEAGTGR